MRNIKLYDHEDEEALLFLWTLPGHWNTKRDIVGSIQTCFERHDTIYLLVESQSLEKAITTTVDCCGYMREHMCLKLQTANKAIGRLWLMVKIDEALFSERKSDVGQVL